MLTYYNASAGGGSLTAPHRGQDIRNEECLAPFRENNFQEEKQAKATSLILNRVVIVTSIWITSK